MAPRVAVVGGGPLGIIALKKFLEDGFDVTLFEGRSWIGGLWKPDPDDSLSALVTTRFNSSRFRIAMSDFPCLEDMDDFPTAIQLYKYFNAYAEHFELWPHVRLGTKVTEILRADHQWSLATVKDGQDQPAVYFDKVAFATGTLVKAKFPKLDGIELFAGPQDHSIKLHDPAKYKDQTVLIVGLHASAQDAVDALAGNATKIYAAHRSGVALLSRYSDDGSVYDMKPGLQFFMIGIYMSFWFPALWTRFIDYMLTSWSKKSFPNQPESWHLSPVPSIAVSAPLIGSAIWPHLESGFCEPVKGVRRFTGPNSVELTDGRVLENIDSVIYCTGYHTVVPVRFPDDLEPYPIPGQPSTWYRNIFPMHPDPSIRNSLALLAHNAATYPGFVQYEAQAGAISQIWQGRSSLSPLSEMKTWRSNRDTRRSAIVKKYSAQETFFVFLDTSAAYATWLDATAGLGLKAHFGLVERWTNSCAWKLWWNDRELYDICLNGLGSPAIFGLFDMGRRKAWSGAREQIFKDNAAVKRHQEERLAALRKEGKAA